MVRQGQTWFGSYGVVRGAWSGLEGEVRWDVADKVRVEGTVGMLWSDVAATVRVVG
jgi:hypothetical protein